MSESSSLEGAVEEIVIEVNRQRFLRHLRRLWFAREVVLEDQLKCTAVELGRDQQLAVHTPGLSEIEPLRRPRRCDTQRDGSGCIPVPFGRPRRCPAPRRARCPQWRTTWRARSSPRRPGPRDADHIATQNTPAPESSPGPGAVSDRPTAWRGRACLTPDGWTYLTTIVPVIPVPCTTQSY